MLTLSVTACDKKKTDTEPLPEEVTEETVESTEPVYIEAADEDFVDIDFNISIIDDEPPVKMNVADLSGVDFGERLTPCKTESEYRDRYGYTARYDDPEMQAEYERLYEVFCNTPSAGHIENVAFIDDKFYFAARGTIPRFSALTPSPANTRSSTAAPEWSTTAVMQDLSPAAAGCSSTTVRNV